MTVYNGDAFNVAPGTPATVLTAKINASGKGKVVAIANADVYCALPAIGIGHDCNASGMTRGYFTLATAATQARSQAAQTTST
ncbi:MAG: hypothetical protein K0S65_1319 [Labilithrix sp.]|nr:hypothetical protein [Labilithrix sp.]